MKSLLRTYVYHLLALWFSTVWFTGAFSIKEPFTNFLVAAAFLSLLNTLLKPILKLLFFPINTLSLGLFSLVINSGVFYLFYKLTPAVAIDSFIFPGSTWVGVDVPAFELGFFGTLFIVSLTVSLCNNFLTYLAK